MYRLAAHADDTREFTDNLRAHVKTGAKRRVLRQVQQHLGEHLVLVVERDATYADCRVLALGQQPRFLVTRALQRQCVDGGAIEIAFNVKYMTDVLNVIETPQVALETTSAMEPGVIKPVGDNDFVHIIMPMHFGR